MRAVKVCRERAWAEAVRGSSLPSWPLQEKNWGNLVVAIDPGLLGDRAEIARRVQTVLDRCAIGRAWPAASAIGGAALSSLDGERPAATGAS